MCGSSYVSCDLSYVHRINDIQNVTVAMETLVNYFDPSGKNADEPDGEVTMVTAWIW